MGVKERGKTMEDTICAIATNAGIGAISIIRVSGKEAISIVNKIFKGKNLVNQPTHSITYGHIRENDTYVDEVLIMLMKAPKTFTMEDTVEINCHGGIAVTKKILELLLKNGCRLAEAGEFTKRAFLNGRISLLEAESVNDLIVAKTEASRMMAINNVDGILTKKIRNLRQKMVQILSNIEVNIDYPEYEDEVQVTGELLQKNLGEIMAILENLVNDSQNGRLIKEGINIAIIGRPNVGKSSILNALIDEEKAIVTNIAGTTRDIVEGSITLNGVQLNFIDTAGIRESDDIVEQIGVDKSKKVALTADLVLFVFNNNEVVLQEELDLLKKYDKKELIIFINKDDLEKKIDEKMFDNYPLVWGNTISEDGLKDLLEAIKNKFSLDKIVSKNMAYLSNLRQIDLINKASDSLKSALESYQKSMPIDIIQIDLRQAWEYLGELIGDAYNDELIDNIFSNFCLGK